MKYVKTYQQYLTKLFVKNLFIITGVFASLTFILNILEEIKFFKDMELGLYYPFLFTILNLPSVLFEIFPFIILITTQMFFIHLYTRDEVIIFKNYGVKNIDIIKLLSVLTLLFGFFLVFGFHTLSSNLKHNYLGFKNNFTEDNKYLAVINESGLWIKDEINDQINIVNAEGIENNLLINVSISQLDKNYELKKTIYADRINIEKNIWLLEKAKIFEIGGGKYEEDLVELNSNFNLEKINNLFSNLSSLNIFQLTRYLKDYKSLGYSTLDIESSIHKLIALPVYLVIMILIGSMLMMNVKNNKSKVFNIIMGIILSVLIYYINYFFNIMGINERLPIVLSIWFPLTILLLFSFVGLVRINEK